MTKSHPFPINPEQPVLARNGVLYLPTPLLQEIGIVSDQAVEVALSHEILHNSSRRRIHCQMLKLQPTQSSDPYSGAILTPPSPILAQSYHPADLPRRDIQVHIADNALALHFPNPSWYWLPFSANALDRLHPAIRGEYTLNTLCGSIQSGEGNLQSILRVHLQQPPAFVTHFRYRPFTDVVIHIKR